MQEAALPGGRRIWYRRQNCRSTSSLFPCTDAAPFVNSATANQPFVFRPAPPPDGDAAGSIVGEARREIAEIVREVAAAVRCDRSRTEFAAFLCDRTLRAMAAEGICLWQRDAATDTLAYTCVHRLGRITDRSIEASATGTHGRLLAEIGADGGPVVVPPTPHSVDMVSAEVDVPANPTHVPVAIAPIECDVSGSAADYLLEVFLESGGGVATQRGYLRFVAQMADLAGEFFRHDRLRTLRRREKLAAHIDDLIAKLHAIDDTETLAAAIVDGAADALGFDRVGLLEMTGRKARLIAVSHVHSIDHRSAAAEQLRAAVDAVPLIDGDVWNVPPMDVGGKQTSDGLFIRAIASGTVPGQRPVDSPHRFVGLQAAGASPTSEDYRDLWTRYTRHASLMLQNKRSAGRFTAWSMANKQRLLWPAALIAVTVIACVPVPLIVDAPAVIRPETSHVICAPRDAVVDTVHVTHGQAVTRGELLLTLTDSSLQEQITSLVGRRSVLDQQRSRLIEALVESSSSKSGQVDQVQMQRSLVAEEITALDEQLAVLRSIEQSLTIRADRDGIVDAWQIDGRLRSRPVRRGDELMRVVAAQSDWLVEARVPQNRIAHLSKLSQNDPVIASVSLEASPDEVFGAELCQIGPAAMIDGDPLAHTSVLLRYRGPLGDDASPSTASGAETESAAVPDRSGAPARVAFDCGNHSLVYVMFQDLFHRIGRTVKLYLS
jgi:hypothetical protein